MDKTLLFLACVTLAGSAFAQQYKWVDKNGKVQYGDSPPPGVKVTPLKAPPPAPTPVPAASAAPGGKDAKKALTPEQAFQKRQKDAKDKEEKEAKTAADAAARKENCARAQDHLRTLQSGQRQARVDSKGERVFLDDAQIAQEVAKTQESIRQACSS